MAFTSAFELVSPDDYLDSRVDLPGSEQTGLSSNTDLSKFARFTHLSPISRSEDDFSISPESVLYLPRQVLRNPCPVKFRVLHLGFDTVEWHCPIDDELQLSQLWSKFEQFVDKEDAELDDFGSIRVWRVGQSYKYAVDLGSGLRFFLPRSVKYPIRVIGQPVYCLSMSDIDLHETTQGFVALALGIPVKLLLSRVDVALDVVLSLADLEWFTNLVWSRDSQVVCRARKIEPHRDGSKVTGFRFGSGAVVLRVYDKREEAQNHSGNWEFWHALYEYRSGAPLDLAEDETVVRFEFQQRVEFLRQLVDTGLPEGVRTISGYLRVASSILEYLTLAWFRLAGPDCGHFHERETLAWWQGISDAFLRSHWYAFNSQMYRDAKRRASSDVDLLMNMAAGCLASASAALGHAGGSSAPLGFTETVEHLTIHAVNRAVKGHEGAGQGLEYWRKVARKRYEDLFFNGKR